MRNQNLHKLRSIIVQTAYTVLFNVFFLFNFLYESKIVNCYWLQNKNIYYVTSLHFPVERKTDRKLSKNPDKC